MRSKPRIRPLAFAAILLLGAAVPAAGSEADPLAGLRRGHATRLAEFGSAAKDARLGSLALPAYQEALSLDPESDAARTALGWKRDGASWTPPDPRLAPGANWPDDGEGELAKVAKREAALKAEWVEDLVKAATALKAKGAASAAVERLLWAAIAADPMDAAPRRMLGHLEEGGRWFAPETKAVLESARADAKADLAWRTLGVTVAKAEPLPSKIAGWPRGVPAGSAAPTAGTAYSLTDPAWTPLIATALERAKGFLETLLGAADGSAPVHVPPIAVLHVGARDIANAVIDADPSLDAATKRALRLWPAHSLGTTGYMLIAAEGLPRTLDAAVGRLAEGAIEAATGGGANWLERAVAYVATRRVLGTYLGYGATPGSFGGEMVPTLEEGERVEAYLRRLVGIGADTPIEEIAAKHTVEWRPRYTAKAGALLDWLFHKDPSQGRAFVAAYAAAEAQAVDSSKGMAAAARAAGFDSPAALDEAWRRFALDAYPPSEGAASALAREPWRVTKLSSPKAQPAAVSLFEPASRAVSGFLLVGGRTYTCAVTEDGKAVRLMALAMGQPPRVVSAPGVYPFVVRAESSDGYVDFHIALANDGAGWLVRSADAFAGTIDGHLLTFLDLDCDARFGGFDRDGYVVGNGAYVLPLRREIVLGPKSVEIRRVGPDGREVAWRSRLLAAKGKDLEALLRLNAWRVASGVPALPWDAEGSAAASLHAEYLAGAFPDGVPAGEGRREDPARTGATPAGHSIAPSAAVASGSRPEGPAFRTAVDRMLASVRERSLLLDPEARRVATGHAGAVSVLALSGPDAAESASAFRGPVVFPPPDAEGIPTRMAPEGQALLPDLLDAGMPITLQFGRGEALDALSLDVSLSAASGAKVDLVRLDPATHGAALEGTSGLAAFVPKSPLSKGAAYRLTALWVRGGKAEQRSLSFKTGSL